MDPDDIGNLTSSNTSSEPEFNYQRPSDLVLIPTTLVTLASIVADVLMVFTILKFKNLQTITNLYFLNWRICNILFFALSPINFIVLGSVEFVEIGLACAWFGEILVTLTGTFMFAIALTLDWYVVNYCSRALSLRIRNFYRVVIFFLWLVLAVLAVYICFDCLFGRLHTWSFAVATVAFLVFFTVQVLRFVKLKTSSVTQEKSNLILILISIYFACWIPNYIVHCITTFDRDFAIHSNIVIISNFIAFSHSIFLVVLLCYYDGSFQSSFKTLCNYRNESYELEGSFESVDIKSSQNTSLI